MSNSQYWGKVPNRKGLNVKKNKNNVTHLLSKELITKIIHKINELYITTRSRYLILDRHKNKYDTKHKDQDESIHGKFVTLNDKHISEHLYGNNTIGVFGTNEIGSKFITFDVDSSSIQESKIMTYYIYNILIDLGIPQQYIYLSFSGRKGFHIEIYFSVLFPSKLVQQFYDIVSSKANELHRDVVIEFRGTGIQHGVKLPLGINHLAEVKNLEDARCWFVDISNGLEPIKDFSYILNIQQIDVDIIMNILDCEKDLTEEFDKKKFKWVNKRDSKINLDDLKDNYNSLNTYKQNVDERETAKYALDIYHNGIQYQGSRHNNLFLLARYFRFQCGMERDEIEKALIEWMQRQDKSMYKTQMDKCIREIKYLSRYVCKDNITFTVGKETVIPKIYKAELDVILNKVEDKNAKLILFSLLMHSKRFAHQNKDGHFYMSYQQMMDATGIKAIDTCIKYVNMLEELNMIVIVSRNVICRTSSGEMTKNPNTYKILFNTALYLNDNEYVEIDTINYTDKYYDILCKFYTNSELKLILKKSQYGEITKYRKYSKVVC